MRRGKTLSALICTLCLLAPAMGRTQDTQARPAQAELFSTFMQRYAQTPEFREKVLQLTESVPKIGGWLTPDMVRQLRSILLGKDWKRADHFPGFTMGMLNSSVDATVRLAGKAKQPLSIPALLDLGPYAADTAATVDLDRPATHPTYSEDPSTAVTTLAPGIVMGDGPDPALAPMHAESLLLAEVLNRLALNAPGKPALTVLFQGRHLTDAGALIRALQNTGHSVQVDDDLYFANFGHLHDHGRDVMMPFWLDTQIAVPATLRSLLLPVSHSEHELHVRGPLVNADVSYYFGIDGKSEFRTMDSLNQPWVLGRKAFVYHGAPAVQAIDLLAEATRVYLAVHLRHPELPFGGYYTLGVCQDTNAAVEEKLQGKVTLFPITHQAKYFPQDARSIELLPRDDEFLKLFAEIPSDRGLGKPPVDRILGALPTTQPAAITIPGLAADVQRVEWARSAGLVRRTHPLLAGLLLVLCVLGGLIALGVLAWRSWRRSRQTRLR